MSELSLRTRLSLEALLDRILPSTFQWAPKVGTPDDLWTTLGNWDKRAADGRFPPTQDIPGKDDTVLFNGVGKVPCDITGSQSVNRVEITPGCTTNIDLVGSLNVGTAGDPNPGLLFNAGIVIQSTPALIKQLGGTPGTLSLQAGSKSSWANGGFVGLNVNVSSSPTLGNATCEVAAGGAGRSMADTNLNVAGTLTWTGGDVLVTSASELSVLPTGTVIVAGTGAWGVAPKAAGATASTFQVINRGVFASVPGGANTLNGDFTNSGTAKVVAATLTFGGSTTQTGGSFLVSSGGAVNFAPVRAGVGRTLVILDGTLYGNGTIAGNVSVGSDPNLGPPPQTAAVVEPGIDKFDAYGTLTINGTLRMFGGSAEFTVGDGGLSSQLAVGTAILTGGKVKVYDQTVRPPVRTYTLITVAVATTGPFTNAAEGKTAATIDDDDYKITYRSPGPSGINVVLYNYPPVGQRNAFEFHGVDLNQPAPGVLADATDPEGDPLTDVLITPPPAADGTLVLSPDGGFTFTPTPAFLQKCASAYYAWLTYCGPGTGDPQPYYTTFTYAPADPLGPGAAVTDTILFDPTLLSAPPVFLTTPYGTPVGFAPAAADVPGPYGNGSLRAQWAWIADSLAVTDISPATGAGGVLAGTVAFDPASQQLTFTPAPGFTGTAVFAYSVTDPLAFNSLTDDVGVTAAVTAAVTVLSPQADPNGDQSHDSYVTLLCGDPSVQSDWYGGWTPDPSYDWGGGYYGQLEQGTPYLYLTANPAGLSHTNTGAWADLAASYDYEDYGLHLSPRWYNSVTSAPVTGIEVIVYRQAVSVYGAPPATGASVSDAGLALLPTGQQSWDIQPDQVVAGSGIWPTDRVEAAVYGGPTDLWGLDVAQADGPLDIWDELSHLNVALALQDGGGLWPDIEAIQVKVWYGSPPDQG